MRVSFPTIIAAALLGCTSDAFAQPIDPSHAFSWQENCGWMNWAPPTPGQGVFVAPTYLSGSLWCENIGWLSVGQVPADGLHYANTNGSDYGVNIDPVTGELSGFGWSENGGWVNFHGGAEASPPSPARLSAAAGRFFGFAWSENFGWINLDDPTFFVGNNCAGAVPVFTQQPSNVSTCGQANVHFTVAVGPPGGGPFAYQ
jgi:hypothetical protein